MGRSNRIRAMLVLLAMPAALAICHPIPAATTAPADTAITRAIDQLGADDPAARDAAESELVSRGKLSLDRLRDAATNDASPEVRTRALRALRTIRLFLVPGVPDAQLSIAQEYLASTDLVSRKRQLSELFQIQPQPNVVLTRLAALEPDEDLRRQILYQLATGYREAIGRMLVDDDDLPGVLGILDESAQMWPTYEAADEAMALYLCNEIDPQIAICLAEQTNGDTVAQEHTAARLCYMYRVCGKYDQALKYARLSNDQSLIDLVLQDQGDWSALAKEPNQGDPVYQAGYRAEYQRLAGHPEVALQTMQQVSAAATDDSNTDFETSRMFLLNDMPQRGMELLGAQNPESAFQMRVTRGEISQAIAIAQKYNDRPQVVKLYEELRRSLGELPPSTTQPAPYSQQPAAPDKDWQQAVEDLNAGKYQTAADEFGAMWARDHSHFDRLYLQGYALQQAGQTQRGQKLMMEAEMLPLADSTARWKFAEELDAAGLTDAAEQQRNLALRGEDNSDEVGVSAIYESRAEKAMKNKQWQLAAVALDREELTNFSPQLMWNDPVRYLTYPALVHLVKARAARQRHDFSAMNRELQSYEEYLPISTDMVIEMVPALDDLGEHARADEIFNRIYEKQNAICRQYPKGSTYLNDLAWMCACCDRKLDEGFTAAQTAVGLQPDNWQLLDTLAEVRFRRGDRAAAVDIEKHAMSEAASDYLARQIKRFESAAIPSTTRPGPAPPAE